MIWALRSARPRSWSAAAAWTVGIVLLVTACTGDSKPAAPTSTTPSTVDSTLADGGTSTLDTPTGPHTPPGREPDATQGRTENGVVLREADFGDITLGDDGEFRAPVRAHLVTPVDGAGRTPLVVIGHLRYPACPDMQVAYPCPNGAPARRFDAGMVYLAERLAEAGYSTLIPDLSPLYVGDDPTSPYDQADGLDRTLSLLLDNLDDAVAGRATRWGDGLTDRVDTDRFGFIAHSRSGTLAGGLVSSMAKHHRTVSSVLVYGGAFDVAYHDGNGTDPAMPDVPVLAIVGDQDQDTDHMGTMWLSAHLDQRRAAPALAAVVPGLGHTFVNRTLSEAGIDDRICAGDCPPAAEHERFLGDVAARWLDATMGGAPTELPLEGMSPLPDALGGLPVTWLATTDGPHQQVFAANQVGTLEPFGPDGRADTCYPPEPMAPAHPDDCPIPDSAVIWEASPVTRIRVGAQTGVHLATGDVPGTTGLAIHLAPSDDRTDGTGANPLIVEVGFADGRTVTIPLTGDEAPLRDRATKDATGVYTIATLRIPLPDWAADAALRSVVLRGDDRTGADFDIRAIDVTTT